MATRRERVIIEAVDEFTTPVARMAAAAALLDRNIGDLDGATLSARREIDGLTTSVDRGSPAFSRGSREIDRYSGRLRLLSEAALVLGPALVPIGASAVPAIAGLTAGLGAAAGATATAVLAFSGMGDALESIGEYRLEPTTENLEAMRLALAEVGPAGAEFAEFLSGLAPALDEVQNVARGGMFPGLQEGIENLLPLLPQVERIVGNIAEALGGLAADAGDALSSERFEAFFDYIETDAGPTLDDFGRATGNVVEGLANLMVAFAPLSRDFSGGLEDMTRSFAEWTAGLSETEGFQEFVAYVRQSGPQVIDLLGSLGNALVGIAQAAAPFGQAVVPALTALADILGAIASSPVGPPLFTAAAGFMAISRASTIAAAGVARFNAAAAGGVGGAGFATKIAGVAAAFSILGNEFAKLNGSKVDFSELEGDLNAIANGGGADAIDNIVNSLKTLQQGGPDAFEIPTLGGLFGNTPRDNALEQIQAVDQALAQMVASGNAEKAAKIFDEVMSSLMGAEMNFSPSIGELPSKFTAYANALETVGPAAESAARGIERAAIQTQRTRAEMVAARQSARETARGFITLGDALDDSSKSFGDWLRQLEVQAQALRDFTRNARTAAERGLNQGLIKSLNEAGPAGAMRMRQLANATDAEIGRANKAWRDGQQAIRDYVNMQVPPKKLRVESGQAFDAIAALKVALKNIPDESVTVSMVYKRAAIDVATGQADGGTVPKTGRPYADRHLYMLADGEEVISNRRGQADRFRPLLKAINNAADGATVGFGANVPSLTPNSQLYGIDQAFLSVRELAERLGNLSAVQLRGLQRDIDGLSKKSLTKLSKALEQAADDARADLQEVRQARSSLADSVKSLITGGDLFTVNTPSGMVDRPEGMAREDWLWLVRERESRMGVQSNVGGMLAEGRERLSLIRQIKGFDVDGQALANLATQPIEVLRELASSRRSALRFERQYEQLQRVGTRVGSTVGDMVYAKEIRQQTAEVRALREDFRDVKHRLNKLEEIRKATKDGADKVANAVTGATGNGARRHRR